MNVEILGRVQTPMIDYRDVPMAYWPKVTTWPNGQVTSAREQLSAVCRSMDDCQGLVQWFDNQPNFCPDLPVLLLIPGAPTLVAGLSFATAAELRDCCVEAWGVKTGADAWKRFEPNEMRERMGLARKEDVPEMVREAFHERVKRHKASPRSDPPAQWQYPNPSKRTLHTVADPAWAKKD